MLPRFCYELGSRYESADAGEDEFGDTTYAEVGVEGYLIHDRRHGHSEGQEIAMAFDVSNAERIVAALNQTEPSAAPSAPRHVPSATDILAEIEAFKAQHGLTDTQFGTFALRSHGWVRKLRDGKLDPKLSEIERVYRFMNRYDAVEGATDDVQS